MPLYEFECRSCGHISELMMKISDPVPTSCQKCQKGPLQKMISKTNFVLKGQGWYETDFKTKPKMAPKSDIPDLPENTAPKIQEPVSTAPSPAVDKKESSV